MTSKFFVDVPPMEVVLSGHAPVLKSRFHLEIKPPPADSEHTVESMGDVGVLEVGGMGTRKKPGPALFENFDPSKI